MRNNITAKRAATPQPAEAAGTSTLKQTALRQAFAKGGPYRKTGKWWKEETEADTF